MASQRKYEVFLSFRGEDVRNTFISHLHHAIRQRGITTFFDEDNLKHGVSISPELVKAIEESKFAIIVFSKDYASSKWCLDELVKIMECRAKNGLTVIPIFYDVDPSDVRKQKNSFAESFAKHEINFKDKVGVWKEKLKEAANLAGLDLRGKKEASCIKTIVTDIFKKLPRDQAFTEGFVGMESHLQELHSLLPKNPDEVCFLGIWGMGGIGKTTIARAFFSHLIREFKGQSCFLQDVSKRKMTDLQKILLMKVLHESIEISDAYEGSIMIRETLCFSRVLLVLDDVDDVTQIESLAGERDWFDAGSIIIVTTRDKHLLEDVDYEPYEVNLLSESEAMQLFHWHAFRNHSPTEDFVHLSRRVVTYASGLPLALKVLGCHLRGRGLSVWESALERLKDDGENKIFDTLKISYDGLNDNERDIFLDIACFYRREPLNKVKKRLRVCDFHPEEAIDVLTKKSLLVIQKEVRDFPDEHSTEEIIEMIEIHDLIQEMGQHIVRLKANKQIGRCSRLWLVNDFIDVLKNNTASSEIEALVLDYWEVQNEVSFGIQYGGVFRNMNRLRLLEIHSIQTHGGPDYLPNSLRWLSWSDYPASSLPTNFEPWKLAALELPGAKIEESPDFSTMPNLELINLSECYQLLQLHPSVGNLNKLVRLCLNSCISLTRLPRIIQMECLQTLDLNNCEELLSIPENITCCSRLQTLDLESCCKLRALPDLPPSMKTLRLGNCNALAWTPNLVDLISRHEDLHYLSLKGSWRVYGWKGKFEVCVCTFQETIEQFLKFGCRTPLFLSLKHIEACTLRQTVPEFLSAFWDWERVSRILCPRKEILKVVLPGYKIPDFFFHHTAQHSAIFYLSPSSYNADKLRGFALCAIVDGKLKVCVSGLSIQWQIDRTRDEFYFLYIPIDKLTSGREYRELIDCCLLTITAPIFSDIPFGFRLVYEGEVRNDNDFRVTGPGYQNVCQDVKLEFRVASESY